ncbi:MAG: IS66 family transposase [Pseudonocardiaceae bacterium]
MSRTSGSEERHGETPRRNPGNAPHADSYRRRRGCGKTTTAAPPFGAPGTVVYGPNVNAAAIPLASEGNVPIERTAALMAMMLGAPVSTGFVARTLERFAQRLQASGFDDVMKAALRAEDVLCADETPTNVIGKNTDEHGELVPGSPHAVTVRTPDARLVWYAAIGSRSKTALADLGVLEGYSGHLVRDDYAGWHQFDTQLAGVQQCAAHLICGHAKGVLELHPTQQNWAAEVITILREANTAVAGATAAGHDHLDPRYSPTCADATTTRSPGASPPTDTATGPKATTPDTTSPHAWPTKPNKSGPSPETSPYPGQTTPASKPSKAPNDIKPSPATGTR